MNNTKIKMITMTIFTLFLTTGCENDSPTAAPESATISGIITFTGDWPADGTVAVSLSSNWPPQGAPAASLEVTSTDLSSGTYVYTLENVTFGSYASIFVSWEDPTDNNPATNQHTLGAYGGVYPFLSAYYGVDPTPVTVSDILYELTTININADLKYVDACQKQINQGACEALDHCMWYPAESMGPSQTSDGCY